MRIADSLKPSAEYTQHDLALIDTHEIDEVFEVFLGMDSVPAYNLLLALLNLACGSVFDMDAAAEGLPPFLAVRTHLRKHCLKAQKKIIHHVGG